jgi:hypothetical protein
MSKELGLIDDIIKKISTPGDFAAGSLGFAGGLAADIFLFHLGIPPGYMTALGASSVLGLKKGYQAANSSIQDGRKIKKTREDIAKRVKAFEQILKEENENSLRSNLKKFSRLWEQDVMDDEKFLEVYEKLFNDFTKRYIETNISKNNKEESMRTRKYNNERKTSKGYKDTHV